MQMLNKAMKEDRIKATEEMDSETSRRQFWSLHEKLEGSSSSVVEAHVVSPYYTATIIVFLSRTTSII